MPVATINFTECEQLPNSDSIDIYSLQSSVMVTLDRYFGSYGEAAAAQVEYRRVLADIDADTSLTLFGTGEAIRAGLAAYPMALSWSEFEREAAGRIKPVRFSIRFTG